MSETLYGWYSPQQANRFPVLVYEREGGTPVEVTLVTSTETVREAAWPDLRAVGRVTRFLREVRRPMLVPAMEMEPPPACGRHGRDAAWKP